MAPVYYRAPHGPIKGLVGVILVTLQVRAAETALTSSTSAIHSKPRREQKTKNESIHFELLSGHHRKLKTEHTYIGSGKDRNTYEHTTRLRVRCLYLASKPPLKKKLADRIIRSQGETYVCRPCCRTQHTAHVGLSLCAHFDQLFQLAV